MGIFDFLKKKKKSEYIPPEPMLPPGYEKWSKKKPEKSNVIPRMPYVGASADPAKKSFEEQPRESGPLMGEYDELSWALMRAWRDKTENRKTYNYENGIVEEVYDYELLSTPKIKMLLEEHKEETEKLIAFYTENEPNEYNLELYDEFMGKYGNKLSPVITDKEYNKLCTYISRYYDERPTGRALFGIVTVYKLSYDNYQNIRPSIEKEISILMDDSIEEAVKEQVMKEIRWGLQWSLTPVKCEYMI